MTHQTQKNPYPHGASARAFTLAEVMFAVLILGIGLISIASLFPVAGAIQKNTMDDVTGEFVASNIEAKLKTRGISETTLLTYVTATNTVTNLTDAQLVNLGLPLSERVFPEAFDLNRNGTANENATEDNTFTKRNFYWRPLFMRDSHNNWKVYVFVQRRVGDPIPTVSNANSNPTNRVNAGDWTVTSGGTLTRATQDTTNSNWKGVVAGNQSTTLTVLTLSNGVIR